MAANGRSKIWKAGMTSRFAKSVSDRRGPCRSGRLRGDRRRAASGPPRSRSRSSPSTISTAISSRPIRSRRRADGATVRVPAGGAAYLASAIAQAARRPTRTTLVVSAGDMISASPLVSARVPRRADHPGDEPDRGRFQRRRQPRIRPRPAPSCCACRMAAASSTRAASPAGWIAFPRRPLQLPRRQRPHRERAARSFPAYGDPQLRQRRARGEDRLHRPDARGTRRPWSPPRGSRACASRDEADTINALVPQLAPRAPTRSWC